jgi:hypothetical protein
LPPGQVTLLWGFDLPREGSEARVSFDLPWRTLAYRVVVDNAPGMIVQVAGMPAPVVHSDAGRSFLVTEIQRRIGDKPLKHVEIRLSGIPGPGPMRWIALAAALFAAGIGFWVSRRPEPGGPVGQTLEARRRDLLDRAREIDAQHRAGETGPEFHARSMAQLEEELAALLLLEATGRAVGR